MHAGNGVLPRLIAARDLAALSLAIVQDRPAPVRTQQACRYPFFFGERATVNHPITAPATHAQVSIKSKSIIPSKFALFSKLQR